MERVIIIRYGEIFLKGKNRSFFESLLVRNIKQALDNVAEGKYVFTRSQSRYFVESYPEDLEGEIMSALKKVFGIHSLSAAYKVNTDAEGGFKDIKEALHDLASDVYAANRIPSPAFRVTVKRADKHISMKSYEIAAKVADAVSNVTSYRVDLNDYDYDFQVDIRESGYSYVYIASDLGAGGLPVGCSSKGMLLLSGGIDSPVAAYMMAKRGMKLTAVHFASPPYTSERAKQKVVELRDKLAPYTTDMKLFVVPFTEIQLAIHEHCPEEFMITIMRRFMMRVATILAKRNECKCIITGESLGQVASQTVESMTSTEDAAGLPIFRPLIAFDKDETVAIAKKIDTYDISIQPFEDCCTVFLPKNPVIHPALDKVRDMEKALDIDGLVTRAIASAELL